MLATMPDEIVQTVINLVTYIASENADLVEIKKRVNPVKRKGVPASKAELGQRNWDVAFKVGPEIEKRRVRMESESTGTGTHLRPHVRAAHWHRYWVGSGNNRRITVRWISEIFVNAIDAENMPAVERQSRHAKNHE